ncbi:hypothetical protein Poli38472_010609 [Pythium oligandrum]|uniref:Ecdysoneless n=1 Tax=Pythium oligandrum TaxID=41045 RepID=A0A8K1FDL9_PYTOL|nr:hypothetical protein Poli38472_010609 [Pythium oligandrum]|eukprot:TMW55727.1 hypothetical protein Poli38472_010609 [Pythium oligandrum]
MFPAPSVEANVIRFRVFFRTPQASPASLNASTTSRDDAAFVETRCAAYQVFVDHETQAFVWHKHRMHLQVTALHDTVHTQNDALDNVLRTHCLVGETAVGDAIQDEWVVTWLLVRLTKQFEHDDLVVQVTDTDGEFLLIECADVLPDWVSPENSTDRVFVRRGQVHLVPLTTVPDGSGFSYDALRQPMRKGSKTQATSILAPCLKAVCDEGIDTRASSAIQRVVQHKLSEVPEYVRENQHRLRCILPLRAAHVLSRRPELLGGVVEAFYYREPTQASAVCRQMKVFSPIKTTQHMVTFARCQYAQLKQQQFHPPKPFHDLAAVSPSSPDVQAIEFGVKLACGLELLYASDDTDQFDRHYRSILDELLRDFDESKAILEFQNAEKELGPDDDESWLYMHPDSLEDKLQRLTLQSDPLNPSEKAPLDDPAGGAEALQEMATMFNDFVSGISGLDGVEGNAPVQFDMSSFMQILNGGLEKDDDDDDEDWNDEEDDEEPGSDDEEEDDRLMRQAMEEMDAELFDTTVGKTFTGTQVTVDTTKEPDVLTISDTDLDESTEPKPLDLDMNLLSNLLESLASQEGLAGPVSNIMSELTATRMK